MENIDEIKKVRIGPDLFSLLDEPKNLIQRNYEYNELTEQIKENVHDILESYLEIGRALNTIKDKSLYEMNDYKNIYEYSSAEVGLSKTTTKNLIAITKRFCEKGSIKSEYEGFGFSHLVELLSVDDKDLNSYVPSMTVKAVRSKKYEIEINKQLESLFDADAPLTKIIDSLLNYDWVAETGLKDFNISHEVKRSEFAAEREPDSWDYGSYSIKVLFFVSCLNKKNDFSIEISFHKTRFSFRSTNPWIYRDFLTFDELISFLPKLSEEYKKYFADAKVSKDGSSTLEKEETQSVVYKEFIKLGEYISPNTVLHKVCTFLSTNVFVDYFYEQDGWSDRSVILYASSIKDKKTNQALFKLTALDDPLKATILNCSTNEETLIFDDFDVYLNKKMGKVSKILN